MIYQSNITALGVYGRYARRLGLQEWAQEKIWETEEAILTAEDTPTGQTSGTHPIDRRDYPWRLDTQLLMETEDAKAKFYRVRLIIEWKEGQREERIFREGHVQKITQ